MARRLGSSSAPSSRKRPGEDWAAVAIRLSTALPDCLRRCPSSHRRRSASVRSRSHARVSPTADWQCRAVRATTIARFPRGSPSGSRTSRRSTTRRTRAARRPRRGRAPRRRRRWRSAACARRRGTKTRRCKSSARSRARFALKVACARATPLQAQRRQRPLPRRRRSRSAAEPSMRARSRVRRCASRRPPRRGSTTPRCGWRRWARLSAASSSRHRR